MQQFLYDGAVAKCLSPFLSAECNNQLTCATSCTTATCGQCAATDQAACHSSVFKGNPAGQCQPYLNGLFCAQAAYSGPAGFCDPTKATDIGSWLQGVGTYYCSK
jgi:hypothetical protein